MPPNPTIHIVKQLLKLIPMLSRNPIPTQTTTPRRISHTPTQRLVIN